MKGSIWNCKKSIPVAELSEAELKEAIHEWAEGCDSLEELLWLCYNNGIKTNGCCAGAHHFAYVDFLLNEGKEKLLEVMSTAWKYGKINFFCQFYGNPRSGPDWYKTVINLSPRKNADAIPLFGELCSVLKKEVPVSKSKVCKAFLDVLYFFDEKKPDFLIHMNKKADSLFHFYFTAFIDTPNIEYYSKLFGKIGYTEVKNPNKPIIVWEFETEDENALKDILETTLKVFESEWTVEIPSEPNEMMDYNFIALIMRRKFGTDEEGVKKFNEWMMSNWGKPFKDMTF